MEETYGWNSRAVYHGISRQLSLHVELRDLSHRDQVELMYDLMRQTGVTALIDVALDEAIGKHCQKYMADE